MSRAPPISPLRRAASRRVRHLACLEAVSFATRDGSLLEGSRAGTRRRTGWVGSELESYLTPGRTANPPLYVRYVRYGGRFVRYGVRYETLVFSACAVCAVSLFTGAHPRLRVPAHAHAPTRPRAYPHRTYLTRRTSVISWRTAWRTIAPHTAQSRALMLSIPLRLKESDGERGSHATAYASLAYGASRWLRASRVPARCARLASRFRRRASPTTSPIGNAVSLGWTNSASTVCIGAKKPVRVRGEPGRTCWLAQRFDDCVRHRSSRSWVLAADQISVLDDECTPIRALLVTSTLLAQRGRQ